MFTRLSSGYHWMMVGKTVQVVSAASEVRDAPHVDCSPLMRKGLESTDLSKLPSKC